MIEKICHFEDCTGCSACKSICPTNAITMKANTEGFFHPIIDKTKCIGCAKCIHVCPSNNFDFSQNSEPPCYAVMASDELRKESSSGAFFPILAEYVIKQNGQVAGAGFDEEIKLKHFLVSQLKDLKKLKGSKYLQSQLGDIFSQIKQALEQKQYILFTGTPCQVAGLKNFLSKDYERLLTVDLICHGVPSQKVFDSFLQSEFPEQTVLSTCFRDDKSEWGNFTTTTITSSTTKSIPVNQNTYLKAFFTNISLRTCCYNCKYAKIPRVGDFTMADFWGVPKEMNDKKGTSLVLLNSPKAEKIFNIIKNEFKKNKQYPLSYAIKFQPQLKKSANKHPARQVFFNILNNKSIKEALEETVQSKKNIALLNYHWVNGNFGAVLTAYALNKFLNEKGYFACNLDYYPAVPWADPDSVNPHFDEFRKKYLPLSRRLLADELLIDLNQLFSTFIVGSDQVWRHDFIKRDKYTYFFAFTKPEKKLISYAASFGIDKINASAKQIAEYKLLLSSFDSVSVREDSGVKICQDLGIKAKKVCDPVFLLSQQHWIDIANKADIPQNNNEIIYYTINPGIEQDIIKFIKNNQQSMQYDNICNISNDISVEAWLNKIMNCKLFITDSFHGSCFAIIFNKPFICVNTNTKTSTRMQTLFDYLEINNRLYGDFNTINLHNFLEHPINYQRTNQLIESLREYSIKFLIDSIESPIHNLEEKKLIKAKINRFLYNNASRNKYINLFKYLRYKFYAKIYKGQKKEKYQGKCKDWKAYYKRNKSILKEEQYKK